MNSRMLASVSAHTISASLEFTPSATANDQIAADFFYITLIAFR